jgi:RNA polymerase sigma-70 factor, ECF subfamily
MESISDSASAVERVFLQERGRILATLIRLLGGDFDRAEDALASALEAALRQWPDEGQPENPRAWLIRVARNKATDDARRQARADRRARQAQDGQPGAVEEPYDAGSAADADLDAAVADDRLRLIFTCCHPALPLESQVALTLRTLGGLQTTEIARAFLVTGETMAKRLVRAKDKIRVARIPYRVPDEEDLPARLAAVMAVVYLVFNEGYAATSGDALVRRDLAAEAIRLGRLLCELVPERAAPRGLLALMLLQDSRRDARVSPEGDIVLLEDQDRARWDRAEIDEGLVLVESALRAGRPDAYALQAAIAALHARAASIAETDWAQIAALYAALHALSPSPVVRLNHAIAVAMSEGPEAGLSLLDALAAEGTLPAFHLLSAARADMLRRLGRHAEAADAYREALSLVGNEPERRFLESRLAMAIAAGAARTPDGDS